MFRFIGRLYFWLVLVPSFWKILRPTLLSIGEDGIQKLRAKMPPEGRARFDRAYPRHRGNTPNHNPTINPDNRRNRPHFPMGFTAQ